MRRLAILGCAALFAACAPMPKQPEPVDTPQVQTPPPKRFDGLVAMAEHSAPVRDAIRDQHRFNRIFGMTRVSGLRYFFYEPDGTREIVGFVFQNTGSPRINPEGLKRTGPRREFAFRFADRARENIHLTVNDDVKISRRFSHDNMFREWHFFPRRQLPTLTVDEARGQFEIRLPTGEPVRVDRDTKELVGGVLREEPIDFNRSRHQRHNPRVHYRGDYLAITVAQRGEAPRRATVWGQTKYAEVHYPAKYAKACRISPKHIWDQRPNPGDSDPRLTMLHRTDAALFDLIERRCGWDLAAIRSARPAVAGR